MGEMERIVAPSVLSMDFSDTKGALKLLEDSKASWIHFDVMDGHFVPNLTFGPDILRGIRKGSTAFLDVHLMTEDPGQWVVPFRKAGADLLTFHTEALDNDLSEISKALNQIRQTGARAGFSVKPGTPIEAFESLLPETDLVLIMSVEPGFGGQSFMTEQLKKVKWLYDKREEKGLDFRIEIDGGINGETWKKAVEAGADTLVAGSWLFSGDLICKTEEMLG